MRLSYRHILCALMVVFSIFCVAAVADGIKLDAIAAQRLEPGKNLIENASFEAVNRGGVPDGWSWSARNTTAKLIATTDAHSGKTALRLTNDTEFGADVYGMFWRNQAMALVPGHSYVISAWTKSKDPGIAWIGGGNDWQYRLRLPATGGDWQHVWMRFTAVDSDTSFVLRVCTESPCKELLLDDVKVEEGETPTPDALVPAGTQHSLYLSADRAVYELEGDGKFEASFSLIVTRSGSQSITAQLRTAAVKLQSSFDPGVYSILIAGRGNGENDQPHVLKLSIGAGATTAALTTLRVYSARSASRRAEAIKNSIPKLSALFDKVQRSGQDVSYPKIQLTILHNFTQYATEDIAHGEVRRALSQLSELEAMAQRCQQSLQSATAGKRLPVVPKWTANEPVSISHSSFIGGRSAGSRSGKNLGAGPVFFTGYGAFGQVRQDLEKLPGYGANIIQIEIGPSALYPREGVLERGPIEEMQRLLVRAQKAGVAINLLISPHYFPDWMLAKFPHLKKHREGFLQYCIHAPESRELLQKFVSDLIPPLRGYPALHSICLSNEPVNMEEPCQTGLEAWHAFLANKYHSLAEVNRLWNTRFTQNAANTDAMASIPLPDPFKPSPMSGMQLDYLLWNREAFSGWHKMLAEAVHRAAPELAVHAKAMSWTMVNGAEVRYGVDARQFGAFSDINGCDSVNFINRTPGRYASGWLGNDLDHDLQRSVKDAPVFNSENHIIEDRDRQFVPAQHVYSALWQEAIHGQSATVIWVWERSFDPKSDTYGSIMHRPDCTEAVGRVNYDLNRAAVEVTALQQTDPQVTILRSVCGAAWEPGAFSDCFGRIAESLAFFGLKPGFVTEQDLESGVPAGINTLIVPGLQHISQQEYRALWAFAQLPGKTLIVVGGNTSFTKDEYDRALTPIASANRVPYEYGKVNRSAFHLSFSQMLETKSIRPAIALVSDIGGIETAVAWRCTADGQLVSMVNYGTRPETVHVRSGGKLAMYRDVLASGAALHNAAITLQPLEVRLLRIPKP